MTKVAHTSTTSTDTPRLPVPRDLPALPGSPAAELQARIDAWDVRIPTAPKTATLTAAQLQREIDAAKQHDPYLLGGSESLDHIGQPYAWGAL
jgi:hypothetical protein